MEWNADLGLRVRMALAMALVVAFPFAFVYAFVFAMNTVGTEVLELTTNRPWNGRFYVSPLLVAVGVVGAFGAHQIVGVRATLRRADAHRLAPDDNPDLHQRFSRLAARADVEAPDLAWSSSNAPNAFTIGPRPSKSTVVVTDGLLETLSGEELDAVLAHELAHVKNRDAAVMSVAFLLPTLTYVVAIVAWKILSGLFHGLANVHVHADGDRGKGLAILVIVVVTSTVISIAISLLFWVGSFLLYRVLARHREYAADRGAVAITGDAPALASALRSIDDEMDDVPDDDLRAHDGGLEAMYVAPVDDYQFEEDRELISSDLFPESHPPTDARIERLRAMAGSGDS